MFNSNRKGQLMGTTNALIVTTIVVAVILIISFILVRALGSPATDDVASAKLQGQAIVSLEAYLQTPVSVNVSGKMQAMEMSDLIRLAKINSNYASVLSEKTHEILDKVYPNGYGIEIPGALIYHPSLVRTGTYYPSGVTSNAPDYSASEKIALPGDISVTLYLK